MPAKGIASRKTLEKEPPAAQQPEALDRVQSIRRTCRREPAGGGRQGRDALSVEVDPPDHEPSKHSRSVSRVSSSRRSGKEASYPRGRARISRSSEHPRSRSRGRRTVRPISRRRRRSRFRSTTVLPYRGTTVPSRGAFPDEGALKTSSHSPRPRLPSRRSARISFPRRTRTTRGNRSPSGARPPRRGAPIETLLRTHLHGEPLATLPATAVQRIATSTGLHSGPETMLVQPLPVPGPVCRFHPLTTCSPVLSNGACRAG